MPTLTPFAHGYALLIGVGRCQYDAWSLPVTVQDAQSLRHLLVDPALCAYPDDENHLRLLHDEGATGAAILEGLAWLQAQTAADPQATAIVYYSGHGWVDPQGLYYLIHHAVKPFDITNSALSATAFAQALRAIPAQRLLVLIDCCHAEGMATAKTPITTAESALPPGFAKAPPPPDLTTALKQGAGRAVFTSSRGQQKSWILPDKSRSLYTHHLLEALRGANNRPGDTTVRVSNLMNHLGQTVPASAATHWQQQQTPFFDTAAEDFAVALLHAGKGLPTGGWNAPPAPITSNGLQVTQTGSGGLAIGPGARAAGARGVVAGTIYGPVSTGNHVRQVQLGQATPDPQVDPVAQSPALQSLRAILSSLYETEADTRRIAQESGIDTQQVNFSTKPVNFWHHLLVEAHKQAKVKALVSTATFEYAAKAEALRQAYQAYTHSS